MNTDHIISNSQTQRMECQHCGFTQAVKMPVPLDDLLSQFDAFMDAHKGCKRPPSEAVMSEYIVGFNAGYSYVIHEIERYVSAYKGDKFPIAELLHHLANVEDGKTRAD
jgi:hypothetical protein